MWCSILLLIILILYPYLFYPLILIMLPKTNNSICQKKAKYKVSLYIAAYNEEAVIEEKLKNSLELDVGNNELEIVVGSDGSTDKTNDIVNNYAKLHRNIRLLNFQDRAGKVNVLNRGIPLCNGDIILLSDANAMYNQYCLSNILPHFNDENVGCVAGEKRILDSHGNISNNEGLYWNLESKIKALEDRVATVIGADGACYAIRKKLFKQLPKDTSVDDFLLSMKIVEQGYKIAYEPNAYSYEETGSDVHQEIKRKVRIAAGNFYNLQYLKRFWSFDIVSFMYIGHKVLRWISPLLFLLLTMALLYMSINSLFALLMLCLLLLSYLFPYLKYNDTCSSITDSKIGSICSYFYLTVWAQWLGYKKYLSGTQKAIWETVRE